MATFCQTGDTARVTFSDGEILEFPNSPISIEEKINYPDNPNCKRFVIYYSWLNSGSKRTGSKGISSPFGGLRIESSTGVSNLEVLCKGVNFNCGIYQWYGLSVSSTNNRDGTPSLTNLTLDRINYYNDNTFGNSEFIITKTFTITDSLGSVTTKTKAKSVSFSVDCIAGCPDGTLDCGDCCLPCDDTFNQISGIRSLLSRIK
jgi:hypothetical protein